jgi:hypothetical protein
MDSHPVQFAAAEAAADRPACVLIAWETSGALKWRTYPNASLAVLIGLHDMLASAIDEMQATVESDDDDAEDA